MSVVPAADVDDHVAGRFGHRQARADRRGHRLVDQVDFARLHAVAAVLHRAALDLRDLRRHANHEPRAAHRAPALHLAHEIHQHLLGGVEIGDDAVLHRTNRLDVGGRAPEHLVRLGPDRLDRPLGDVERHDRWLVEDDAAAAREDTGIGGTEVDGDIGREGREQAHVGRLRDKTRRQDGCFRSRPALVWRRGAVAVIDHRHKSFRTRALTEPRIRGKKRAGRATDLRRST